VKAGIRRYQIEKRLPGGRHGHVVIAVIVPVVVDIETVGIEVADVDAVAVRIHLLPASINATEA
jgi:hypothetical protein